MLANTKFRFSIRTRIMSRLQWFGDVLDATAILILASIAWLLLYSIYFTSGLKIVVHKDTEWKEQMEWMYK